MSYTRKHSHRFSSLLILAILITSCTGTTPQPPAAIDQPQPTPPPTKTAPTETPTETPDPASLGTAAAQAEWESVWSQLTQEQQWKLQELVDSGKVSVDGEKMMIQTAFGPQVVLEKGESGEWVNVYQQYGNAESGIVNIAPLEFYGAEVGINPDMGHELAGSLKIIWSMNRDSHNPLFNGGAYTNYDNFLRAAMNGPISGVWFFEPAETLEGRDIVAKPFDPGVMDWRNFQLEVPKLPTGGVGQDNKGKVWGLQFDGSNEYIPYFDDKLGIAWLNVGGTPVMRLANKRGADQNGYLVLLDERSPSENAEAITQMMNLARAITYTNIRERIDPGTNFWLPVKSGGDGLLLSGSLVGVMEGEGMQSANKKALMAMAPVATLAEIDFESQYITEQDILDLYIPEGVLIGN